MDDAQLLDELISIRRRTRRDLSCGAWRWMTVWAVVSFGFVVTLAVPSLHTVAARYWLVGVPVGIVGTMLADASNRGADRRVRRREWPYWATAAGITVANTMGSAWLPGNWILIWLWVVLAAGFSVLLWLEDDRAMSRLLAGMAVLFAAVAPLLTVQLHASIAMGAVFALVLAGSAWLGYRQETM